MVLVDELKYWHGFERLGKSCHLLPQDHLPASLGELHAFALSIGLYSSGFQDTRWPHYEINRMRRARAIKAGATEIDSKEYIRRLRDTALLHIESHPNFFRFSGVPITPPAPPLMDSEF